MQTKLHDIQKEQNAKFIPFAGYEMPVWYDSIKKEHLAVRENAGVFDISHMGIFKLKGETAFELLQYLSCNELEKAKKNTMVYTMLLNEKGTILDDVMIGSVTNHQFLLIVNAANKSKIAKWIKKHQKQSATVEDQNKDHCFLAVQGPKAVEKLKEILNAPIQKIERFGVGTILVNDHDITLLRTGYTGEEGFECIVPNGYAEEFWQKCIESEITPCGLGARDTLRIEKGLPLYGQELSESINPLMTRYPWVVKWDHDYIGKEALLQKKENPTKKTIGFQLLGRQIPRFNQAVKQGGVVTSGTLSPSLNEPIGMAIVDQELAHSKENIHIDIRGNWVEAKQVNVPFI